MINAFHTSDYQLVQAFVNTLSQVFPSIYTFDVPGRLTTEIVGTMKPTSLETFRANMEKFSPDDIMGQVAKEIVPVGKRRQPTDGLIFTNDLAPVELFSDLVFAR